MLNRVEVRTEQGLLLNLPLFDMPEGYLVKDIEGLDPVDAVLTYSSVASTDDEQEQSSKRVKRFITLKIGYEPDWANQTVKTLRDRLMSIFMPKTSVWLRFYSDDGFPTVEIQGRVEKFHSPLFAREPEATINVTCAKSSFVNLEEKTLDHTTVSGITVNPREIVYGGSVETGFLFSIFPDRSLSSFTIRSTREDDTLREMQFSFPMVAGDVVTINSVQLNKAARLLRSGNLSSVLYGVSPDSTWLNLFPGVNKFSVIAAGATIPYQVSYLEKFGGL